jgi:hypothetical protein
MEQSLDALVPLLDKIKISTWLKEHLTKHLFPLGARREGLEKARD